MKLDVRGIQIPVSSPGTDYYFVDQLCISTLTRVIFGSTFIFSIVWVSGYASIPGFADINARFWNCELISKIETLTIGRHANFVANFSARRPPEYSQLSQLKDF